MDIIKVFLQGVGISKVVLLDLPAKGHVSDVISAAKAQGTDWGEDETLMVWLENSDDPLDTKMSLDKAGVKKRSHLHVHTCRHIKVTVNFQNASKMHPFSPSITLRKIKKWADKKYGIGEIDSTEHALQLCNSSSRPSEDTQLGSLVGVNECELCFDLVPKIRVEGSCE